jgi:hypothetical protein
VVKSRVFEFLIKKDFIMKKILFLTLFLLISVNLFSQNFNASQSSYRNVQSQTEGEIDFDRNNNQNQNEQAGTETQQINQPVSQDLTHIITFRLGFGYNALYNVKSFFNKDSASILFGIGYSFLFIKASDNLRFGLTLHIDCVYWAASSDTEKLNVYQVHVQKYPHYVALDMSLMPTLKYKSFIFGTGIYYNIPGTRFRLYDETDNIDADYGVFLNPKIKGSDYGIISMIGIMGKKENDSAILGILLELRFSVNKPILYYDYYKTGFFPYVERGANTGDGNYFTLMVVFIVGGAW